MLHPPSENQLKVFLYPGVLPCRTYGSKQCSRFPIKRHFTLSSPYLVPNRGCKKRETFRVPVQKQTAQPALSRDGVNTPINKGSDDILLEKGDLLAKPGVSQRLECHVSVPLDPVPFVLVHDGYPVQELTPKKVAHYKV